MIWLLVFAVFLLDRATKMLASSFLSTGTSLNFGSLFSLTLVHNPGAAFGVFKNATFFFILISLVSIILIFTMIRKKYYTLLQKSALALILAGALGNLVDRLRLGYVIDFIDFKIWPVFNIADSAITVGAGLLILTLVKKPGK